VFVNFTAAWCITCKVNELVAMQSDRVIRVFDENNVTYMKGDWTNEDPEITAALAEYGRNGVPLYLFFDKDEKDAQILPQILTEDIVIQAVTGR
jgi:thiol:disulfide interchange protein DsbD